MLRKTKTRIIGLAIIGIVALGAGIYATASLTAGAASAYPGPAWTASTQANLANEDWRGAMLDMMEDHMGFTGAQAEEFADRMIDRMRAVHGDSEFEEMIDWCTQNWDQDGYGPGGRNGYGPGNTNEYGPGMMGGYGNGATRGGMMGGGMMGGW